MLNLVEKDPRSPTTEFTRTPIMTTNTNKHSKSETALQNKGTDNVRKILLCSNAYKTLCQQNQKENMMPRLLETSTKIVKQAEKRKSFVGLLETNLDFQETDLDNVMFTKQMDEMKLEPPLVPAIPIFKSIDADPRSPTTDFLRTPIQIVKKIGEIDINADALSDNETTTEVPDIVQKLDDVNDLQNATKENLLCNTECVEKLTDKIVNVIPDVLLHNAEDTQKVTPISTRTPLGQRDINSTTINKSNKLKVSDKPTKRISKIPVYKSKIIQGKLQPCENTPPRNSNTNNKGRKKPEWDANKSIII